MSKYLVLYDEQHYPSIYVVGTKHEADIIYEALISGWVDYYGEFNCKCGEGNIDLIEVEDTTLETIDWVGLKHTPIHEKVVLL